MELRSGATRSAVCGVRAVRRSCSWIVGRLQKSTSGARPSHPEVNNLEKRRSSHSGREPRSGEHAPGAGHEAAKPRHRWRAPPRKKAPRERYWGALVGGRRSGSTKPPSLTWRWRKRSLAPRTKPVERPVEREARQRASGVLHPLRTRSTTPRRGGDPQSGSPSGSSESLGWRRTRGRNGPKLRSCRQAHLTRGRVAARRAGVASSSDSRVGARRGRRRRKSSSLENRTIAGARVVGRLQKSVRSTFLVPVEGSREANQASAR